MDIPYLPEYFRRMLNYPHMDLEYTFWQMVYLCISPSKVYRATSWHKRMFELRIFLGGLTTILETKNQWARDDPAFVAIMIIFLAIGSLSYAVAFQESNILNLLRIMFSTVLIDFVVVGCSIATLCWFGICEYFGYFGYFFYFHSKANQQQIFGGASHSQCRAES
jgi:hypothetical protein